MSVNNYSPSLPIDYSNVPTSSPETAGASITILPQQLILRILAVLDCNTHIHGCRRVCRQWKKIVEIIPPKLLMPNEYGSRNQEFSLENLRSARREIAWGYVKRYRKVFLQEPEKVLVEHSEIEPFGAIFRQVPSKSCNQEVQSGERVVWFHDMINDLYIKTESHKLANDESRLYIEIAEVIREAGEGEENISLKEKIRMKFTTYKAGLAEKIQYLLNEDLLFVRVSCNDGPWVLICQWTTGEVIFNSRTTSTVAFPQTLLKMFKEYEILDALAVTSLPENGSLKKYILIRLKTDSPTPKTCLLKYNLDDVSSK